MTTRASDDVVVGLIHGRVQHLQAEAAFDRFIPFPQSQLRGREVSLGGDHACNPIRRPVQWLNAGLGIFANTRAGKTLLLFFLLLQLVTVGIMVWVSEIHKRQLRQLPGLFEPFGEELVILRTGGW